LRSPPFWIPRGRYQAEVAASTKAMRPWPTHGSVMMPVWPKQRYAGVSGSVQEVATIVSPTGQWESVCGQGGDQTHRGPICRKLSEGEVGHKCRPCWGLSATATRGCWRPGVQRGPWWLLLGEGGVRQTPTQLICGPRNLGELGDSI
jgi:hypothetical protein